MEFIRQNVVLIAAAGIFLLLAVVLLSGNMVFSGQIDDSIAEREQLVVDLESLTRRPINDQMVKAQKKWVRDIQASYEAVLAGSAQWNRRNFEVISAQVGGQARTIYAFPVNPEVYDTSRWRLDLTKSYVDEMAASLEALKPASPPSETEVSDEVPHWINRLLGSEEFSGMSPDDPTLIAEARLRAREAIRQGAAQNKLIYADAGGLDYVFSGPVTQVTPEDMWRAQVNLWVTQDVLAAIRQTNEAVAAEAIQGDPESVPSVSVSGVRRLLRLTVYGMRYPGVSSGPSGITGRTVSTAPPTVTERQSGKLFDAVYYDLMVIMPLRHLERFQRTLMARNYHTVLSVNASWLEPNPTDLFYYGPEPMLQVTLRGELLLLTSWVRGAWDETTSNWRNDSPPLMPVGALRALPAAALRPEDQRRLR